jgi:hypothetical protein
VVAHRARQQHVDLAALCGSDQAVQESVVGDRVRTQQELAVAAATGDQVELTRKHLAREHGLAVIKIFASGRRRDFAQLMAISVRWLDIVSETRTARRRHELGTPLVRRAPCQT